MRTGGRPRGITHTLGIADQRPRDAIGGIATAFRGRNVNRRAASRAVVRADGVDGRSRREWEREAQEAALSIIPAEQSHRLFPSAITSPSIYSPPRFLPSARARLPSFSPPIYPLAIPSLLSLPRYVLARCSSLVPEVSVIFSVKATGRARRWSIEACRVGYRKSFPNFAECNCIAVQTNT